MKPSDDSPTYDAQVAAAARLAPPTRGWALAPCCRRDPWDCVCPSTCEHGHAAYGLGGCQECQ